MEPQVRGHLPGEGCSSQGREGKEQRQRERAAGEPSATIQNIDVGQGVKMLSPQQTL